MAQAYDIRYSIAPITESNFSQATRFIGSPAPRPPGSLQFCVVSGLAPEADYFFAMKTTDERGNWSALSNIAVHTGVKLGIEDEVVPLSFGSPMPNPARQEARFDLSLPSESFVDLQVFDVVGRHVATIASGNIRAGRGSVSWDLRDRGGRRVQPGLYLARADIAGVSFVRRVMVTN
jgi:hypothetical protein